MAEELVDTGEVEVDASVSADEGEMDGEVVDAGEVEVDASEEGTSDVGIGTEEEFAVGSGLRVVDRADDGIMVVLVDLGVVSGTLDEEDGSIKDVESKSEDGPTL